jgi:hypothetical protein
MIAAINVLPMNACAPIVQRRRQQFDGAGDVRAR